VIFDLKSGKRRRVVQVVFGFLAVVFAVGFVGFGIGGETQGGIFDAIGLGGGDSGGDVESTYEQNIEDAEKKLDQDPKNEDALNDLARYHFLAGQENLELDEETGVASVTDSTRSSWDDAIAAWEDLLKTDPKELDVVVANQIICAYVPPLPACAVEAPLDEIDLEGAADTQELVAQQEDSAEAYAALAQFHYFDGNIKAGDEARDEALALADGNLAKQLDKGLEQLRSEAQKFVEQQKQAEKAGGEEAAPQLENPFGGLGGEAGGIPPATTP
jgi:tetratricopeptide (TPR) repeat protein